MLYYCVICLEKEKPVVQYLRRFGIHPEKRYICNSYEKNAIKMKLIYNKSKFSTKHAFDPNYLISSWSAIVFNQTLELIRSIFIAFTKANFSFFYSHYGHINGLETDVCVNN